MPLLASACSATLSRSRRVRATVLTCAALLLVASGSAQSIYVATWGNGTVGAGSISTYHLNGALATAGLITGLTQPSQMVIAGNELYVVSTSGGTVSKFDLNGTGGSWLTSLTNPTALTVYGDDVFVGFGNGTIARYDSSGALQSSFTSDYTSISSLAATGGLLYVAGSRFDGISNVGWISSFDHTGGSEQTIAANQSGARGLTYAGTSLYYLTQPGAYTVWNYNTADLTPTPVALVTGLNGATDTAFFNDTVLFTYLNGNTVDGRVGTYSALNGTNLSFLAGLNEPYAIALGGAIPEPSTYAAMVGALALGFVAWRRRPVRSAGA